MDRILKKAFPILVELVRRERAAGREVPRKAMKLIVYLDWLLQLEGKDTLPAPETCLAAHGDNVGKEISGQTLYPTHVAAKPTIHLSSRISANVCTLKKEPQAQKFENVPKRFMSKIARPYEWLRCMLVACVSEGLYCRLLVECK